MNTTARAARRRAIVTGGSAGIGAEICRQMQDEGFEVISLASRAPAFTHARLHSVEADLADRVATAQAAHEAVERYRPDTLVHNAGVILPATLEEVKLEDLDTLVNIHLSAAILLSQAMLPAMKADGFGRIVLLSSRGALGLAGRTSYGATKSGMLGMAHLGARTGGVWHHCQCGGAGSGANQHVSRDRSGRQPEGRGACGKHSGQASGAAGGCGARGALFRFG
jgi:3-oxoacyl-[acyl-carrier protein] reductase